MYYDQKESGMRIAALRKKMGLTQEQAAEKFNMAVNSYGNIERGFRGASIDLILEMAVVFDSTSDYILAGWEAKPSNIERELREIKEYLKKIKKKV